LAAAATSPSKLELPFVAPVPATPVMGGVVSVVVVGVVVSVVVVPAVVDVVVDSVVVGVVVVGVVDVVGVVVDVVGVVVVVVVVVSQTLSGLLTAAFRVPGNAQLDNPPGAAPRMRSTWKKQSGNATVNVYVPPPAKVPSLDANSVCGKETFACGIV